MASSLNHPHIVTVADILTDFVHRGGIGGAGADS